MFRTLGERRARSHILRAIAPKIEAAGGRPVRFPSGFHEDHDPAEAVRAPAFHDAMLRLLSLAEPVRDDDRKGVRAMAAVRLDRLHEQVCGGGALRPAGRAAPAPRAQARQAVKRLHYLGEFVAPLSPRRDVERYMKAFKPAQDALGEYDDEVMAASLYRELAGTQDEARFAVNFLEARRSSEAKACRKALKRLADARPFWR